MPRPLTGDDSPSRPPARRRPPPVSEPAPTPASDQDSRGHDLAMRLPEWDLVPPTEFLDRTRRR